MVDPGSVLSYDEEIIRFMGRAKNTVLAKNKLTKKGYEGMMLDTPGNARGNGFTVYLRNSGSAIDGEAINFSITDAPFSEYQ